ncbi:ATP-binding protein [Lentzea sp. CA-135723]|uniref:ATP-binding protein n=1 Tax=Lentzea sp. CA-135723 TaxID=3239950 RepID=UPI003D8A6E27
MAGSLPVRLSSFVGRQELLSQLRQTVTQARQTTLIGVGGAGKTRLALELADQVHRSFDDVRFVALAGLHVPDLLVQYVATAVGVRDLAAADSVDALVEVLAGRRRMLLVLDNCEHLSDAVGALVATLLAEVPQLHIVATSRERLAVPGEVLVDVPPLSLPRSAELPVDLTSEAVQLLVDRADAAVPGWGGITEQTWPAVVRLLGLVAGIPLLIELAVARLRSMSVEVMVPRLEKSMEQVLSRGERTVLTHHQSLSSVIGWSYDLCTPREQLLWARASVLEGGFDLAAAEAVCTDDELPVAEIADLIADLVDRSIIIPTPDRGRYRLLEPLRHFGLGKLAGIGDEAAVRARHREHYLRVAVFAADNWLGPAEVELLHGLSQDMPNLRSAMSGALASPDTAESAMIIAVCLGRSRWLFFSGALPEGRHWLQAGLRAIPPEDTPLYASALALDAFVAVCMGVSYAELDVQLDIAAEHAARSGFPAPAVTFARSAYNHFAIGTRSAAIPLHWQAAEEFGKLGKEAAGDQHMALMMVALSEALLVDGEDPRPDSSANAVRVTEEFLAEAERTGAQWAITWAMWAAGIAHARAGDLAHGMEMVIETLRQQIEMADKWGPIFSLPTVAWMLAQSPELSTETAREAATLVAASHTLERRTGISISTHVPHTRFRTESEEILRRVLSAEDYAAAIELGGQVQSIEEALRLFLAEPDLAGEQPEQSVVDPAELTAQQWKVAKLVAKGLSDKDVAAALSLSPRTVGHHLQAIYGRLGLHPGTREGLTRWVQAQRQP